MFYRTENESINFISKTGIVRDLSIPRSQTIAVAENQAGLVSVISWAEDSKGGLVVYDLKTGKTSWSLLGVFYDCGWIDETTLWVSDGKSIRLHTEQGRKLVELCKYSRVPYGPLDLQVSPERSVLGFLRWQGDHRKPSFVFLESKEFLKSKHSCHSLSIQNKQEAMFDHGGSIYKLDILSDTKTLLLKSTKKLIARKFSYESLELKNIRSIIDDPTYSIDHVENPVEVNGRIYFSSFVCADTKKYVSLVSTSTDFEDPRVHLQMNQGLVRAVRIAEDGNYVAMRLWPNTLVKENLTAGWYFSNGGVLGFIEDAELSRKENFA